jgi:hypothetical protein
VLLGGGYGGLTGFRCFGDRAFIDSLFFLGVFGALVL